MVDIPGTFTVGTIKRFSRNKVWKYFVSYMEARLEAARDELEMCTSVEEMRLWQGKVEELRNLISLPELTMDALATTEALEEYEGD